MAVELRLPNIKGDTPEAQLAQIKSYLYQLTEQLNWALNLTGEEEQVVQTKEQQSAAKQQEAVNTFNSIKALIIKSADIVEAYTDKMEKEFNGQYVAISDFGTVSETTQSAIAANSSSIEQIYGNIQSIEGTMDGLGDALVAVNANIKTGILYYDESGAPVYGLEIGQRNVLDGTEYFRKYARFVANRLSFFDENDAEVAYISDYKLYITSAQVTGTLTVGRYFMDTSDGLAFKWV